jgi:predicted tellurium resistance membrane protein TerC
MPEWLIPLLSLTLMEIVLGVDNVIFIAIIVGKLPPERQAFARYLGIGLAVIMRIGLILSIKWIMGLTVAVVTLSSLGLPESWLTPTPTKEEATLVEEVKHQFAGDAAAQHKAELVLEKKAKLEFEHRNEITWKDLILIVGGLFLVGKATYEIHDKLEAKDHTQAVKFRGMGMAIAQIIAIDLIFSLDSVITAVGMVNQVWVMIVSMLVAVGVMAAFAGPISDFINSHPTMKILALAFLILIGVMLVVEGFGTHIDKGYIYFAMAFAVVIDLINMRLRAATPVTLHNEPRLPATA